MSIANLEKERVDRSDKRIRATAFTTVFILAICSAILSYASLYTLAVQAGIHELLASLFPIVIDGLILSGTLLILYFANRGKRSYYGLFLTGVGVVASIAGNVAVSDETITAQLVHAAPPLVLFFALEALSILMRARSKQRIEEETREATAQTPLEPQNQGVDATVTNPPQEVSLDDSTAVESISEPVDVDAHPLQTGSPWVFPEPEISSVMTAPKKLPQRAAPSPSLPTKTSPNSGIVLGDEFESLATTRLKANWLLDRYPDEDHMVLADLIAGDRKYNRKLFKEEVAKRTV